MSVIYCYKQQPQPWMYYITPDKITFSGDCCPVLVTDLTHLLPFQVISQGAFQKLEYRLYGATAWTVLAITTSEVVIEGFYFISYNGDAIAALPCGVYEFKLTAGEIWWFEPIMIQDFTITENALSVRDELMTPFKITEQLLDTTALIAPCDMILPFMFRTSNVTSGIITVYMVDEDGTETAITITVSTGIIDGMTYYWHSEEYLYPFLTCGRYYLKIVDGANTYYSVPFEPECGISDIPDGYKVLRDFNGCVIRNDEGVIEYEEASDIPPAFAPFMMTVDTTKAGSASDTFILPTTGAGYDADIDWGDGSAIENILGTPGNVTHVYAASGTYQISITGDFPRIYFNSAGDRLKLSTIDQWGGVEWSSMANAFMGCLNMNGNYSDNPDLSICTSTYLMFYNCNAFNWSVTNWDMSNIQDPRYMFADCWIFNQTITNWDLSSATTVLGIFYNCYVFNQPISFINMENVLSMSQLFYNCLVFNQDFIFQGADNVTNMVSMFFHCELFNKSVAGLNTSNVTSFEGMFLYCLAFDQSVATFDTSSALNLRQMFLNCSVFNQSVSGFVTSNVTNMKEMFYGCTNFNQSILNFNTANVTDMSSMLSNCSAFKQSIASFNLSSIVDTGVNTGLRLMLNSTDINDSGTSTNYDNTLIAWAAAVVPSGLTFHGGNSKYSDAGQTARTSLINDDSWTITADGGHI